MTHYPMRTTCRLVTMRIWSYVRWSSGMSRTSGISIIRYIQLLYAIPFVSYCFQLDKIACIFKTLSPILMRFSAKESSLIALPNKLKNWILIGPDIRLISLDRITYIEPITDCVRKNSLICKFLKHCYYDWLSK